MNWLFTSSYSKNVKHWSKFQSEINDRLVTPNFETACFKIHNTEKLLFLKVTQTWKHDLKQFNVTFKHFIFLRTKMMET